MFNGKLIVFSAPSGSGKTTIVKHLLKQQELNLAFSISATSRQKRGDEIDGKDYEVEVAADGTLLSKVLEDDDEDGENE